MRNLLLLPDQRLTAARAVFQTVETDKHAVAVFESHLTHALPYHRSSACAVLGQIGPPAKRFLPKIRELRKSKDPTLPATAAVAAYRITGDAREALPTLGAMLGDTMQPVSRSYAIHDLGELGIVAGPLLPKLQKLLAGGDPFLKSQAAIAVKKIEKAIADASPPKAHEPDENP